MPFQEQFLQHLKKFSTSPFLFVGSGISRRFINLETWSALLSRMCSDLGLSKPYEYYSSNAEGNLPKVASLMGKEFNAIWWTDGKYEQSRNDYAAIAKSTYSPFKYEISIRLQGKEKETNVALEGEIALFKKVSADGVITTNWDTFLESIFPDFNKIIGQEELIFTELYSVGEIYKIHGSISKPDSLVLTEEDYNNFHERNPYLAAKLLTLFMEHPIIFMGYSLDDSNIQQILKSIIKCLTKDKIDSLRDRLIFCQWDVNSLSPSITDSTLLISDTVIPIKLIKLSAYTEVFTVLANVKKKIPVKVLRQMKGMVYEFVKTVDPKSKVFVSEDLETLEDEHNVEFVYGIGLKDRFAEVGIKGIDHRDLMRDIIIDKKWDRAKIAKLLLPTLNGKYLPCFKYLRSGGFLNENGLLDENIDVKEFTPAFIRKVNSVSIKTFEPPESYRKKRAEINKKYMTFNDLRKDKNFLHILMYTPILDIKKIGLEDLHAFLKSNLDKLIDSNYGTHYRKLICLYDFLKYKHGS
jgi:hypothetical protein